MSEFPDITFFWRSASPFSQWHPAPFCAPDPWDPARGDIRFAHTEQHMMACKAARFRDALRYRLIMTTPDPRRIKALGRLVTPFDPREWARVARGHVLAGNLGKFSQNPHLGAALLATGHTLLAEASPYDRVWGIGLAAEHPDARDPARWRGTNWLGEVLMEVRQRLRETA